MGLGIDIAAVAAYLAALLALLVVGLILFRLFKVPVRILGKLLVNSAIGGAALFLLNLALSFFGQAMPVNIFNAVFVGILGVPGLVTILILKYIL
jgi:inhibitor of the pro-sigma K processing machinery